jgi:signal transduction histidine kinase
MIRYSILRRYYFTTALVVLGFIALGLTMSRMMMRMTAPPIEDHHSAFYVRLVDRLNPTDRAAGLAELQRLSAGALPYRFALLDENGAVVYPPDFSLPFDWNSADKPHAAYEVRAAPGATPGLSRSLVLFPGSPHLYLFTGLDRERGRGPRSTTVFLSTFGSLAFSALLGIAISMILLFYSLRTKVALADSVLDELQRGNLKARFPVPKLLSEADEIGRAMNRFNRMADEIERLVEQLRSAEKSRMALLQELAHDLRTPVASLKNLLETLSSNEMAPETREELMSLALKEIDYFARLIEDLLVLAQVSEPRYNAKRTPVRLNELLEDEAESVAHLASRNDPRISLRKSIPAVAVDIPGDELLLRRMIRNVLENAFSFARGEVSVGLATSADGSARISIEDDGPGFSQEALASFGERRVSRTLGSSKDLNGPSQTPRLSVGLGSVIARTVARVHRGDAQASNQSVDGKVRGACVTINLPGSKR